MPIVVSGVAQTPAASGRGVLTAEIARYVMMPNNARALAVAVDAINDGIRVLNSRTWHWSLAYTDITTVTDQSDYAVDSNFKSPRHLQCLDSSGYQQTTLRYEDPKTFDLAFPSGAESGDPIAYTVYNAIDTGMLSLNCDPSSTWVTAYPTLRLRYFKRIPYLVTDGDAVDAPSEVELFLLWNGKAYMASIFDQSKIQYAEQKARQHFTQLVSDDNEMHYREFA